MRRAKEASMNRLGIALCAVLIMASAASAGMGKEAHPLRAATGSKAEVHINEGIAHYEKGHWDVATKHLVEAEKADPKSAEAHYDLALVLDKTGDHAGASQHFQKAHEVGKDNAEIHNSEVLKKHLKM
jgi:Tfp pilus assembly protein PilF